MNLSSKLYIIIIVLFSILGLTVSVIFYVKWSESLNKMVAQHQLEVARQTINTIDVLLYERLTDIQVTSSEDHTFEIVAGKHHADNDHISQEINNFLMNTGFWDTIRYLDTKRQIVGSNNKKEIGTMLKDEITLPIYKQALLGKSVFSDVVMNHKGKSTMLFASPVTDKDVVGKPVIGVVIGYLSWPTIQEILENIENSEVRLLTADGIEIGNNINNLATMNLFKTYKNNSYFNINRTQLSGNKVLPDIVNGQPALVSFVHEPGYLDYKGNNWTIFLQTPMKVISASITSTIIPVTIIFLLVIIFSAAASGLALRFAILVPLRKLTNVVSFISSGDLSIRADIRTNDEIGKLGTAFNMMAQRLQSYYGELENRVAEKTKQLAETLENVQDQNVRLEDTKKAMLNLLEDAHELEDKLKVEKENVENKVKERTQELFQEKTKLTSSIENLPVGFMMVNVEADLIVVNNLTESILSGVQKMNFIDEIKKLLVSKIDLIEYIKKCGDHKKRLMFDNLERNDKILRILLSPILTGDKNDVCIGVVILLEDVTEAKIMERSKDEFFSIASHELRTPLTAIRGNTSMIMQYMDDKLKDPQLMEMVKDTHESSLRLIAIVNDFLNLSRLEQGKIQFKIISVDIIVLIHEVFTEMQGSASEAKLYLTLKESTAPIPGVFADPNRVKEVLINLIGNSLKFTEKGGITVSMDPQKDKLKIIVTDTGRGIVSKNQRLLFHKFQQTGSNLLTRDTTKGTGLGLYISKLMIEGMGGKIALEQSIPGKGSIFSFTLPVMKNE